MTVMTGIIIVTALLFCISIFTDIADAAGYPIKATAVILRPIDGTQPLAQGSLGVVSFEQQSAGSPVTWSGTLTSLSAGSHGFHVHQLGNISPNCVSSASHFNPYNKTHGDKTGEPRHIGDLANIIADQTGTATFQFQVPAENLPLIGKDSIVGRTIVVHKDADDLGKGNQTDSLTTGHAGERIGCGVIGYASDFLVAKATTPIYSLVPIALLSSALLLM